MTAVPIIDYVSKQIVEAPSILLAKTKNILGTPYRTRSIFVKIREYVQAHLQAKGDSHSRWIIVPGLRGVGKSTVLSQAYAQLLSKADVEFIYFSLDEVVGTVGSTLHEVLITYQKIKGISLATHQKKIFIFLDEVHYDPNWATVVKTLFDKNLNIFVLATGSSAVGLQRNADEQRRLVVERLFPMSFAEFLLIERGKFPIKGLKSSIFEAIFNKEDPEEVYARLKGLESEVHRYWSGVGVSDLNKYMMVGSIPFASILTDQKKAFEAIYGTIRAIVESDLPQISTFSPTTSSKILQMLSILAVSGDTSTRALSRFLGMSHETVADVLEALLKAELIIEVQPYGSIKRKTTKSKKYLFMSPAIRSAILFTIGGDDLIKKHRGELFEDVIGMSLYREIITKQRGIVSQFEKSGELHADFIVTIANRDIPLEVGLGKKSANQLWNTIKETNANYGLVCHNGGLEIVDSKVIKIPHQMLLLL